MRSNIGICLSHFTLKLYIEICISENTLVKKSYFFTKPKLVTTNSRRPHCIHLLMLP